MIDPLQQYLPFTVLKLSINLFAVLVPMYSLQQYLPFTVLKRSPLIFQRLDVEYVATVLTVYGIETLRNLIILLVLIMSCNSTYRLRYWNIRMRNLQNVLLWSCNSTYRLRYWNRKEELIKQLQAEIGCNSTYRLRYWNLELFSIFRSLNFMEGCNSTYRLRYWNLLFLSFS